MNNTRVNPFTGEMEENDIGQTYTKTEIDTIISNLQGQINSKANATSVSGTFISADIPTKTITVTDGVITNIV